MAENQTDSAVQEQQEEPIPFSISVEDAGPATKKVTVQIPKERVAAQLKKQYDQIRREAAIPGFRKGHAPPKLIEKRFGDDIRSEVRRALISESYEEAIAKNGLTVLGEPEFAGLDELTLQEDAPLTYSFQVEVRPVFTLPEMKGIQVKKPKIAVTEQHVQQALRNLLEQQGSLHPVEDRGVADNDRVTADIRVKVDGAIVGQQLNASLIVRSQSGWLGGFQIENLARELEGARPDEVRTIKVKGEPTHTLEAVRGKDAEMEIEIKDIRRLEPARLTREFLDDLGFKDEQELLAALRQQMDERIAMDIQDTMRRQIIRYLTDNVQMELPARLSERQRQRVVQRRAVQMLVRGVPQEVIEANLARLMTGASEEAVLELKSFFILEEVASQLGVDVSEGELNGRVAQIALHRGRRPERVKQDMAKDGSLAQLYVELRQEKALDQLLKDARVEEVEEALPAAEQPAGDKTGAALTAPEPQKPAADAAAESST